MPKLEPLRLVTYEDALRLRDAQTTPILTQVRGDVTRYRYGDEQHLEEALKITGFKVAGRTSKKPSSRTHRSLRTSHQRSLRPVPRV